MLRTRTAILEAAAGCVERDGVRKVTMGEIASTAGVAKATLYNHFRTKEAVLGALVDARVGGIAAECVAISGGHVGDDAGGHAGDDAGPRPAVPGPPASDLVRGLPGALVHAAASLACYPPLRRVAADEPALLLPLVVPGGGRGWFQARAAVGDVLLAAGEAAAPEAVDLVLRWLVGQLLWPMAPAQAEREAALLASGLGKPVQLAAPAPVAPPQAEPSGSDGLGWPP
ncbi:MAG: TetR/AcrR family transcriptional regulator [Mycobacteriales bacterium]